MAHQDALIEKDIEAYLDAHANKSFLRLITCGSVDDGKSTLIGRLLYDTKLIFEDQLSALENDSKKHGTQGENIDFALLVDGLAAEREQGITIDVAYRFFSTDKRKFIIADTPGHEQYTRNMATGASTADLAIILVDARHGMLTQTRRHAFISSLLGIKHIVVAINKMDLKDYDETIFKNIVDEFQTFAADLGFEQITAIPISALKGDNITEKSHQMAWYNGPALLPFLESVDIKSALDEKPFRMPVQWVNRPNLDFRGFSGTISSGKIEPGAEVIVLPSAKRSTIKEIVTYDGKLDEAKADQAVTLTLNDEIDISRGDVLCAGQSPAEQTDQFSAKIIWMHDAEMIPGRQYLLKTANQTVSASITELRHKINVNTLEHQSGKTLELNEVGICKLALSQPIAFDPYDDNKATGAFILIDKISNHTLAAGMIEHTLRRAQNVHWQSIDINKSSRAELKHQKPCVVWLTGLSGSGKSTIANLVEKRLYDLGKHSYILDGDNVRHGLNKDLGFTDEDRVENIRRVAETAKLMVDAGLIVLVSFISPFISERRMAREMMEDGEFIEVHVSTPLEACEQRDIKGLYNKARKGEIKNFTGIDSDYEEPENPKIRIDTSKITAETGAEQIVRHLEEAWIHYQDER